VTASDPIITVEGVEKSFTLLATARCIEECGIAVDDLGVRRPSLDDVFLNLTRQIATEPLAGQPLASTMTAASR
jgi:hypothetical protein